MSALFHTYLYTPIFAVLIFLYHNISFGDLGVAIIELTLLVRLILLPLFHKSAKDQTIMQRLQPHVRKIQVEHKDAKERQAKELMALYREHRVNPFSGCERGRSVSTSLRMTSPRFPSAFSAGRLCAFPFPGGNG
ncbi:MAG: hypothetical protein B7Z74_04215 [Deltaproteobacteria bacterium 21-66-5]|nr:MAG: hypothetical protein B7Z74_04215 [Deltaproteobacteria bacterium 21-66-5]